MIKKIKILILSLLISNVFSLEANDILYNTIERFKGIDRYFTIDITEQKKNGKKKYKKFNSWTHWEEKNNIKKERILMLKPERLIDVNFWSHTSNNNIKKWMTMPKIGKLKEVKGRFSKKNEFDFSELELKEENIINHVNSILGEEKINNRLTYIIENKKNNKKGDVKLIKKIWIDKEDFIIHKAIYISRSGKVIKEINLSNLLIIDDFPILSKIEVKDFKKNKTISILFSDISFKTIKDLDIFVPKSIK